MVDRCSFSPVLHRPLLTRCAVVYSFPLRILQKAWSIPGSQKQSVKMMLRQKLRSHPSTKNTATGGQRRAQSKAKKLLPSLSPPTLPLPCPSPIVAVSLLYICDFFLKRSCLEKAKGVSSRSRY